jgi:hypothetical protein
MEHKSRTLSTVTLPYFAIGLPGGIVLYWVAPTVFTRVGSETGGSYLDSARVKKRRSPSRSNSFLE